MESMESIRQNIDRAKAIVHAYENAEIMAVVKTRTAEEINFAIRECGITLIGENRVQELLSHYESLDKNARIHLIGTLQKNKVKYIIDKVAMIESLDSVSLAAEIDRHAKKHELVMPVLIEVNIGKEQSKGGILPEELGSFCESLKGFENIAPMGLMTIAPIQAEKDGYRPYFSEMQNLLKNVFSLHFPHVKNPKLSMGMSGSFEVALEYGSTTVRLGEGIFGKRSYPTK